MTDTTQERIEELAIRLAAKIKEIHPETQETWVRTEARLLIAIHPETKTWYLYAKERLEDQATAIYFGR